MSKNNQLNTPQDAKAAATNTTPKTAGKAAKKAAEVAQSTKQATTTKTAAAQPTVERERQFTAPTKRTGNKTAGSIRVRAKRLDQIDETKITLAYWLLAKKLVEDYSDTDVEADATDLLANSDGSQLDGDCSESIEASDASSILSKSAAVDDQNDDVTFDGNHGVARVVQ